MWRYLSTEENNALSYLFTFVILNDILWHKKWMFSVNLGLMGSLALTPLSNISKQFSWLRLFMEKLDLAL